MGAVVVLTESSAGYCAAIRPGGPDGNQYLLLVAAPHRVVAPATLRPAASSVAMIVPGAPPLVERLITDAVTVTIGLGRLVGDAVTHGGPGRDDGRVPELEDLIVRDHRFHQDRRGGRGISRGRFRRGRR